PTTLPLPTPSGEEPPGFLWRIVGGTGGRPGLPRGMDVGPDGRLYVADEWAGLLVISPTGEILTTFETGGAGDVQAADGTLYLALPGAHAVLVLSPEGEVLGRWGEAGSGEGQFGLSSPEHLAVCPDGRIYVADLNECPDGSTCERIQVFSAEGRFLAAWNLSEIDPAFLVSGMDCGDDGRLYLLGAVGGYILVLDGEGRHLEDLGREALAGSVPQGLALGPAGEIVVGTWGGQVLRLDSQGKRRAAWGEPWSGVGVPAAGQFAIVQDVAVDSSGHIYVSDWGGGYAGITRFSFP
ncbi:MAG: NHL repeat-containing protein, partial [Chloroflexia bacterium]